MSVLCCALAFPLICVAAVAVVVNSAGVNVFIRYLACIFIFRTETGAAPISYITPVFKNIWLFVLVSFGHCCSAGI